MVSLNRFLNKRSISSALVSLPEKYENYQKLCRDFVKNEILPVAGKIDKQKSHPKELLDEISKQGFMAINIPKRLGGGGMDNLAFAIGIEEISRGCPSTACIMVAHNANYLQPILNYGSDEQLQKYVKPFTNTGNVGMFALSEPKQGSRITAPETIAKSNGHYYIVNGVKAWITNASEAKAGVLFATTPTQKKQKERNLSAFIFDRPMTGLKLGVLEETMGLRGISVRSLIFEDCKISKSNILGHPGIGHEIAWNSLESGRVAVAALSVGIAQAALDIAVKYSAKRIVFGHPINKLHSIQTKLSEMALRIESARLLTWKAAFMQDSSKPFTKESSLAKLAATKAAMYCTNECMHTLGGIGYSKRSPAERLYRDARGTEVLAGTSEIQRIVISQKLILEYGL